ncbi:MAG: UDP-3-O-(3-hydroxymyristoyl)glucosamine N-acyltransferase [Candidatus Omnitrophica bacterium]|nr:UDP-3-O-(3-hydroxymyristoyl)glucosamine N-acyltransferase [Candidatus Omnitrophota bacterium]MBU4488238.1 UDP-3-O-(3-hydroxymyristoyl)glucosamine N-acyltransferase [Candidatus Omnitrophota bacterium]
MAITVKEIAELIKGELVGDGSLEITGVSGVEDAAKGEITFIESPKFKDRVLKTNASCIIASFDLEGVDKPVIKCKNPSLAVTKIIESHFPQKINHPRGIAKSAVIGKNVKLAKDAAIGANAVIEDNASIGDKSVIYPLAYIGEGVTIGKNTVIYPNVTIRERVTVGDNVIIHGGAVIGADGFGFTKDGATLRKIPQTGTVEIQDNVEIGACVTIDRARFGKTVIGKGSKIDNLVQIAHNVKIGESSIIVAQVGVSGSVNIGNNVMLGGQVGITDHVDIGDNVMVAAKGGVTKSIPPNTIMSGMPARPHHLTKRLIAYIDNLPKTAERLDEIEEKLKGLLNK